MSIIGAEDEDFENDLADVSKFFFLKSDVVFFCPYLSLRCICALSDFQTDDQCKHFNSIEQLKHRPTHLLVFIQHVILQFDPAPLVRTTTPTSAALRHSACVCVCVNSTY